MLSYFEKRMCVAHLKAYGFGPMRVCGGYISVHSTSVEGP